MPLHDQSPGAVFLTKLFDQTLAAAAANFDITNIPGDFRHLQLRLLLRGTTAATQTNARVQFNGDTGSNYDDEAAVAAGTSMTASPDNAQTKAYVGSPSAANATAGEFLTSIIEIPFYSASTARKLYSGVAAVYVTAGTTSTYFTVPISGQWRNTAAITRITVIPDAGNWDVGSAAVLYGMP